MSHAVLPRTVVMDGHDASRACSKAGVMPRNCMGAGRTEMPGDPSDLARMDADVYIFVAKTGAGIAGQ
jgi:hypothetical protein